MLNEPTDLLEATVSIFYTFVPLHASLFLLNIYPGMTLPARLLCNLFKHPPKSTKTTEAALHDIVSR